VNTSDWFGEYFDRYSGSKSWPSDDPEDSPFDDLKCKICGWQRSFQAYGSFVIGQEQVPFEEAKADCKNHLVNTHGMQLKGRVADFPFKQTLEAGRFYEN
jgi:hypothetical protein